MTHTTQDKGLEKKYLGGEIHKILNRTLARKLTKKEYTQIVLLIAGVFDLLASQKERVLDELIVMGEKMMVGEKKLSPEESLVLLGAVDHLRNN